MPDIAQNPAQTFAQTVIMPVLRLLGIDQYRMPAATELLLGTAIQESALIYRRQQNDGPALGLFQMEPATHDDIWANFLSYRCNLAAHIRSLTTSPPQAAQLASDDKYAAALCRVHYLRMGQIAGQTPLPSQGDLPAQAAYWKRFYNTPQGAGLRSQYISAWEAHHPEI